MDNKVNKNMFLLIKTYLIGPYWTIRNNYMVASSATIFLYEIIERPGIYGFKRPLA
jgi:hypothetical protein